MPAHDNSRRHIFTFPRVVWDSLNAFVHAPWVAELQVETLERVNASFVSDNLRGREDDIIWRVKWRDEFLYVYILIEFQSTVDPWMALRIMVYFGLLYQDLIHFGQVTGG